MRIGLLLNRIARLGLLNSTCDRIAKNSSSNGSQKFLAHAPESRLASMQPLSSVRHDLEGMAYEAAAPRRCPPKICRSSEVTGESVAIGRLARGKALSTRPLP